MFLYLGKHGGFIQILEPPQQSAELAAGTFLLLTTSRQETVPFQGTLQVLDDCGPRLTFARANIYSDEHIVLKRECVLCHVVLPYQCWYRPCHPYDLSAYGQRCNPGTAPFSVPSREEALLTNAHIFTWKEGAY
ncbi:hypothetical protein [Thermogemmatispora sp.]|uniref:hypothetical protein n=1 Tax=Thermogemmatispora sp. TaxID=1968838 RepID=UPI002626897E|nr:hypothetical protein [Thermogemmatispora sp.]